MVSSHNGLSLAVFLLRHPYVYEMTYEHYKARWCSLGRIRSNKLHKKSVTHSATCRSRRKIASFLKKNPSFLTSFTLKLFLRNIHIADRDVVWFNGDKNTEALHVDFIAYEPHKKNVYLVMMCYDSENMIATRHHLQKIIYFLGVISEKPMHIKGAVLPLYTYANCQQVRLKYM